MTDTKWLSKYASSALARLDVVREAFSGKIDEAKEAIKEQIQEIEAGNLKYASNKLVSINSELRTYIGGCYGREGLDVKTDSIIYGLVKSINYELEKGGSE